jgi:CheY-like chemotaxis protein
VAHKILVVDDEESLVLLMQTNLEFMGFEVDVAYDGVQALERVAASRPDLILLDVRMPRKTGWEVCKELKGEPKTKDIPVVFLSAYAQPEDINRGLQLGAVRYLKKTAAPMDIMKVVQDVLQEQAGGGR